MNLEILDRSSAKAKGLSRFFTGEPCSAGHVAERYLSGQCTVCQRARARDYYAQNAEAVKARLAVAYQAGDRAKKIAETAAWKKANPDRVYLSNREHRRRNLARYAFYAARRHARKLKATLPGHDDAIREFYMNCPPGMEVDHEVPLLGELVCGLHVPWNFQYLTPAANRSKNNHFTPG